MGIFSTTSGPFDADVEKVTPEEDKGSEDWASILDICDKVGNSSTNAKDCLKSIIRRLNHQNPHVCLKAITLLDACVKNCSKKFHLEVASREFEQEYRKLLKKYQSHHTKLVDNFKALLRKWAENEFKKDPELCLIAELYTKLKHEGVDFSVSLESSQKSCTSLPKDPNMVTSQQEVDDIAKAIELSLKETGGASAGLSSLYPSTSNISANSGNRSHSSKQKHLVKALYDFEAAEDNELTFHTGEIIEVLDDSDKNWWKGATARGEGLFPTTFVTSDLTLSSSSNVVLENKNEKSNKNKNRVQFTETIGVQATNVVKQEDIIINEHKIDRLLNLLHDANPTDDSADTEEMLSLEDEVNVMGPLIDTELEKVDRKHAQLTQLSSNLVDALNLYHSLMREPFHGAHALQDPQYGMSMPVHNLPHPQPMMYNSMNGPYSLPAGMMNDQYPQNSMQQNPLQPPPGMAELNQPSSHHFVPISSVAIQSDSFHPASLMTNSEVAPQPYPQSLDPNMAPIRYSMPPNQPFPPPPQQMPPNFYQSVQQHHVPLQETSSPGGTALQNSNRM